jgi:hypothetical protein
MMMAVAETAPKRLDSDEPTVAPEFAQPEDRPWWDSAEDLPDYVPEEQLEPDPETGKSWLWRKVNGSFRGACDRMAMYLGRYAARQRDIERIRAHYAKLRRPFEHAVAQLNYREQEAVAAHEGPLEFIRKVSLWFFHDFGDDIVHATGKPGRPFPCGVASLKLKQASDRERWHDPAALAWAQEHFADDFAAQEKFLRVKAELQKTPLKKRVVWQGNKPFFSDSATGELVPMEIALVDGAQPTPAMYLEPVPAEVLITVDPTALTEDAESTDAVTDAADE